MLRRHVCISHCNFLALSICVNVHYFKHRLPPQISFLGGKYLYEKRENLAVNNLIKLILNHFYRQLCHCYCQKNTSLNIPCIFSRSVRKFRDFLLQHEFW